MAKNGLLFRLQRRLSLAAKAGVDVPLQAAEHYYLITEAIKDLPQNMPVLEDPSAYGYYRQEGGGLMVGLFEPVFGGLEVGLEG